MKKKIIIKCIIIFAIGFIIYESYSIVEMFNKTNNIEEVNTTNILSNDKSIAIWVQDSEGEEWHEATNRDSWPSPATHGFVGAECTDSDGKEIDVYDILHFDLSTYHATIDTKNSIYCTLYFAKGEPALQKLQETGGEVFAGGGEHTIAVDGMYRYKGTYDKVTNNYICFGTTDKTECLNNTDIYMYRIIGITSEERAENNGQDIMFHENQLKIIKSTPSSEKQQWYIDYLSDIKWDSSSAKSHVTSWYNTNIKGATPNGEYWDSIVTSQKWYNEDQLWTVSVEPTGSQSVANKVSLMYATDYYNAGTQNTNNWLFIKNELSKYLYEWTMSRYGRYDGYYRAWYVNTSGSLEYYSADWTNGYVNNSYVVRPVFYLQSEINLTGTGKSDDPFRITTKNNA